ncbi:hypothetical protein [Streptosporangium sandarakinum]
MTLEGYAAADRAAGPYAITAGPDGALWTTPETGTLARIAP